MSSPLPIAEPRAEHAAGNADSLPVSETFVSIQGEGILTGVPSLFIRLSGCNLRCTWCDTPYSSWSPEGDTRTIDDLVALARDSDVSHAVLTGGEPMMFQRLAELTRRLAVPLDGGGAAMHITIETAGTIVPPPEAGPLVCHLMSISPKLASSTPRGGGGDPRDPSGAWAARHEQRRLNIPVLQSLLDTYPPGLRQLKFVVTDRLEQDLAEIDSLLARLTGWTGADVLLMPEGIAPPTPERQRAIIDACIHRGWRFCRRLHIDLFGNVRGT